MLSVCVAAQQRVRQKMSVTIHLLTPSYCMISFRSPHRHCKTTRSQSSSHSPCCHHSLCCHQSPYCTHSLHNRHSTASHTRHSRPMPSPCRNLRVSDASVLTSMIAAVLLTLSTSNHELLIAACLWTCCAALLAQKRQIAFHLTVTQCTMCCCREGHGQVQARAWPQKARFQNPVWC